MAHALRLCALALLAAAGARAQSCSGAPLAPSCPSGQAPGVPVAFAHTGAVQTYAVPAGALSLVAQLWGGAGGGSMDTTTASGGGGAYVTGLVPASALGGAASLLVAVGGGGLFPQNAASSANPVGLGGARRGIPSACTNSQGGCGQDNCAAEGAGPSALAVFNSARTLVAVAGAGGGAGESSPGGAASFAGSAQAGSNPPYPTNYDRFTGGYNTGGGGASQTAGGAIGSGYDANCHAWSSGTQTAGSGPFAFTSATAVTTTAGLSLCSCGGVGGGGYFGGGPGGWWCGGGGGSSYTNATLLSAGSAAGAGGSANLPGGQCEPNYIPGVGVGSIGTLRGSGGNGSVVITPCFAACASGSYSYGSGACATCPSGSTYLSASLGCAPAGAKISDCLSLPGALLGGSAVRTYNATGTYQYYTVPSQTTLLRVHLWGGTGGNAHESAGGRGAYVTGRLIVTPGETLRVIAGRGGDSVCESGTQGPPRSGAQGSDAEGCGGGSPYGPSGMGGGRSALQRLVGGAYSEVVTAGGGGAAGRWCTVGAPASWTGTAWAFSSTNSYVRSGFTASTSSSCASGSGGRGGGGGQTSGGQGALAPFPTAGQFCGQSGGAMGGMSGGYAEISSGGGGGWFGGGAGYAAGSAGGGSSFTDNLLCAAGEDGFYSHDGSNVAIGLVPGQADPFASVFTATYAAQVSCNGLTSSPPFDGFVAIEAFAAFPSAPSDTAFYLSGSAAEGVSAFPAVAAPSGVTFVANGAGAAGAALALASGSYLTAPGSSAPAALPAGGSVAWSASAWVKCAAPSTWAAALEWGASGDAGAGASPQALALVVGGMVPAANSGVVTTFVGSTSSGSADGSGTSARFWSIQGVAVDPTTGSLAVSDNANNRIRMVSPLGVVTTLAGSGSAGFADGSGATAQFQYPNGLRVFPGSSLIVVADTNNHRVRLVTSTGAVSTLAGSGNGAFAEGTGAQASFNYPTDVELIVSSGVVTVIAVVDHWNHRVRLVTYPGGVVTTLAGSGGSGFADGAGAAASFQYPANIAFYQRAGVLVVSDTNNNRIRVVTYPGGVTTTLAGSGIGAGTAPTGGAFADGLGTAASFMWPNGIGVIQSSGTVVVTDTKNYRVRLITPAGLVSTLAGGGTSAMIAGTGTSAGFVYPFALAVNPLTGQIVVGDANNYVALVTLPAVLPACDSTWHHVALTYSPSASPYKLSAFLDGALVFASAAAVTLPARSASTLRVGWSGDLSANAGSLFAGALSDARVYARALSASEVALLANGGGAVPTPSAAPSASARPSSSATSTASATPSSTASGTASATTSATASATATRSAAATASISASATVSSPPRCPAGSFAPPGAPQDGSYCIWCSPGTYAPLGVSPCLLCPAGTYGDKAGLTSAACSGPCPGCAAGSTAPSSTSLSCVAADARAVPASLGLQLWPAAHPSNPQRVDLVVAPLAQCQQMTSNAACAAAATVAGADGVTRYVVGTAAAFNMEADETLTCQ